MPVTGTAFSKGIFAAATKSTNKTNKAGGTCHEGSFTLSMFISETVGDSNT